MTTLLCLLSALCGWIAGRETSRLEYRGLLVKVLRKGRVAARDVLRTPETEKKDEERWKKLRAAGRLPRWWR